MGLDNIPRVLPCKKAGTAILTISQNPAKTDRVDCDATQEADRCPYVTERRKAIVNTGVTGIMGTDCWYRGKYGNYLLEQLGLDTNTWHFYGDLDDDGGLSEDYCRDLASRIREELDKMNRIKTYKDNAPKTLAEPFSGAVGWPGAYEPQEEQKKEFEEDLEYAAWWLDFVADNADGSSVWY
jgi:hypothetical protein